MAEVLHGALDPVDGQGQSGGNRPSGPAAARRRPAASTAGATDDRYRSPAHRRGPGGHARRQPVRRARQQGCVRRSQGLPAARRHRPRRVLGRQRPAGVGTTSAPCGASRRSPTRASRPACAIARATSCTSTTSRIVLTGAADPRRRDRRARPAPRRRRHGTSRSRSTTPRRRGARPRRAAPAPRSSPSSSTAARTASCGGARSRPTARSATASSTGATTTACSRPGYRKVKKPAAAAQGLSACSRSTTASATSGSAT